MLEIRQANSKDIDLLATWTHALHLHEDDGNVPHHPNIKANLKKWLELEMDNKNGLFLIALEESEPIGFIFATSVVNDNGFLSNPLKGVIHLLWVNKEFRNQGVANALTEAIESCFSELSIGYIECSYTIKNQLAEKFWTRLNFRPYSVNARKLL
ncbi:MAG: GNAT family N-acetyltransferase [Kangiellaceae bacterium]|nr:GNAT family N-acetyltransferase [Kangiellaceae bacterium]MCW8999536.1 GNAT family N-acetyltransferase [Kangiellaceae bacterium]MCW9018441.1 GNAT family N-acetyltransferase [Kangiellaceae bacterium]